MSSNVSLSTHNGQSIKYVRQSSLSTLLSNLQNAQIDKIQDHSKLYNCFPHNSCNFDQIYLNDSIKSIKREELSRFDVGKNEIHKKIGQIKDSPQETTFIENIESQKGQDNQQYETSSICYCINQEEAPPLRETNEYSSYELPVFQVSPFEIDLSSSKQQKGNRQPLNGKNKDGKKNNKERQVKLKEVEELLQIYNLLKIERSPKKKVNIEDYHTKTVRFLNRLCKKGLNRDESSELAFKYGKQIKTISDFYKTLEVLKNPITSCKAD